MSTEELDNIADNADIIVSGYAFTKRNDGFISILNINHPDCAMVVSKNGEIRIISLLIKKETYQKYFKRGER